VTDPPTAAATDCSIARLRLLEKQERDLVLGKPGTQYQLHLRASTAVDAEEGAWVRGRIVTQPVRIDIAPAGGILIEPLAGRPRRVQGRVCAVDKSRNCVVIKAAVPLLLEVPTNQKLEQFAEGQLVTCDVKPGASFEPI
jgi:hypothetical protein